MPMPIYLNEKLLSDIYPIVIDGFIESKSIRFMRDKSDFIRLQSGRKIKDQKRVRYLIMIKIIIK